jgi:distribution and morphology protein 31
MYTWIFRKCTDDWEQMYDAFARDVLDDRTVRKRRIKKVGIWTLQLAAQALFLGLAGNIA